jgi:hypothetical protein
LNGVAIRGSEEARSGGGVGLNLRTKPQNPRGPKSLFTIS